MKHFIYPLLSLFIILLACDPNDPFDPCESIFWYIDADGDGYGAGDAMELEDCTDTEGYSTNSLDCDDMNSEVFEEKTYYQDADGDGFGNPEVGLLSCGVPEGYVEDNTDCDDTNENVVGAETYYRDNDGDGYGFGEAMVTCEPADNFVTNNSDCNDLDADVWEEKTWYEDADGDGLGNPDVSQTACNEPEGYCSNPDDEDDTTFNETGILADFNEHFFGKTWLYYDNDNEGVETFWGAKDADSELEVLTAPFNDESESAAFSYEVDTENEDQMLLNSTLMPTVFWFIGNTEAPYILKSITENQLEIEVGGESYTFNNKETFTSCQDYDRLFNAQWLVADNDITKNYLTRDSIRFIPTTELLGEKLNVYGKLGNTEYPDGAGTDVVNFIVLVNGCNNLYSGFPVEMYDSESNGPHLWDFVEFTIDGDIFASEDVENNQIRFKIID